MTKFPETREGYTGSEKDDESGHHARPGEILQPEARPLRPFTEQTGLTITERRRLTRWLTLGVWQSWVKPQGTGPIQELQPYLTSTVPVRGQSHRNRGNEGEEMRYPMFRISENRTGYTLATVNACLWMFAIWQRGGVDSRGFHPYNESLLLLTLLIFNLPALLLVGIVLIPIVFVLLGKGNEVSTVWIQVLLVMIGTTFQWLLIGFFAGKGKKRVANNDVERCTDCRDAESASLNLKRN